LQAILEPIFPLRKWSQVRFIKKMLSRTETANKKQKASEQTENGAGKGKGKQK